MNSWIMGALFTLVISGLSYASGSSTSSSTDESETIEEASSDKLEESDDLDALAKFCPTLTNKKELKKFLTVVKDASKDQTKTRRTFLYNGKTWFVEPKFHQSMVKIGKRALQSKSAKIKFKPTDHQVVVGSNNTKLRCYYDVKGMKNFHLTMFVD